jgi:hypothetical protein
VLLALLASPAFAATYVDANDAPGRLDIRRLVSSSERVGGRVTYDARVEMFRRWGPRHLGLGQIFLVKFDSRGTRRVDFYVVVRGDGSRVVGDLYRARPRRLVEEDIAAKNPRSLTVFVSRASLNPTKPIRWFVATTYDRAPDRGTIRLP